MDPDNTKGQDKRPLDFSAVLFPRHKLTHMLSVTSQTRPWHLGHLSAGSASLCLSLSDRLTWHRVVGRRWHSDQEVCSLCRDLRDGCLCHISSRNKILSSVYSQVFFPLPGSCPSHFITVVWSLVWANRFSTLYCLLFGDRNDFNPKIWSNSITAANSHFHHCLNPILILNYLKQMS